MNYNVVVGSTYWTLTGVNIFCENLVRGLVDLGVSAHVLLTEQKTRLVTIYDPLMELPENVPIRYLPVQPKDSWGAHWGALIRYLEELAPCVYIPNADWRHSNVSSMLSDRVAIVGVVHSDDPMHYDHVQRLGDYWNAIVTVSKTVAEKTAQAHPKWASKISTIPIGVNVPAAYRERDQSEKKPLRIIYHGLLNQWQKRILDIPKIVQAMKDRNVPVKFTIAGGGNDEIKLRSELRKSNLMDLVELPGVIPHDQMLNVLENQDVFILTSEFEGMPNALLEAMARGCVPVVTNVKSGIPELVKNASNGYLVPVGDIGAFADRLTALQRDSGLWRKLSISAHNTVKDGAYNSAAMATGYKAVFDRVMEDVENKRYRRLRGVLMPPPAESGGFKIFPLEMLTKVDGVGTFPSILDYEDFEREMADVRKGKFRKILSKLKNVFERKLPDSKSARPVPVILSLPRKEFSIVRIFCETLVRELQKKGYPAEILLTEQDTKIVEVPYVPVDFSSDIPVQNLNVSQTDGWGKHWGALLRYLETKAPCIYIPNHDWRHACIAPLLSNRVAIVAVTHGNDGPNRDQISRLGKYFNAIIPVSPEIEGDIINTNPVIRDMTAVIRYGVPVVPKRPIRDRDEDTPLRVISFMNPFGSTEKMEDLLKIVRQMGASDVRFEFTVVWLGSDPQGVSKQLQPKANIELRILPTVQYSELLDLFDRHDVLLWTHELCGLTNTVVDAMARGCVPVAFQSSQEWVKEGWNGFVVQAGDVASAVAHLVDLQKSPEVYQKLSTAAYQTFSNDAFLPEDMAADYIKVFERILLDIERGNFKRPKGSIFPPPVEIDGIGILPTTYSYYAKWLGPFPEKRDYYEFKKELRLLADRNLPRWLSSAKSKTREALKARLSVFRSWRHEPMRRSKKKIRSVKKKVKKALSRLGWN